MALDPSIPLQARAPDFNPLATMLQVGQYKQQQLTTNRLQKDTDANTAVSLAIQRNTGPDGKVNLAGVQSDLAKDPNAAYNLQGATGTNLGQQGQQIDNGTAQINQQRQQLALTSDQQAHLVQHLGSVLNKKDFSYSDAATAAAQAGQIYGLPPDVIKQSLSSMPTDPGELRTWLQGRIASLQAPGAQLGTMTPNPALTNDGATNTYRDTNPITNPGIVGQSFDQKLTPGQATGRMPTVDADGRPGSVPFSDTVPPGVLPPAYQSHAQPSAQPSVAPGRYPQQPIQPQPAPRSGFIPSGMAPGVVEARTAAGHGSGQQLATDQDSVARSGERINTLQSALTALANAQTGTGADKLNAVRGVVAMLGGPADKVASYDEANKYLTQYAQAKAASLGGGTDAQLSAALTGNGNTHISNLAAQDVVKVNMALERMEQARMAQWNKSGLPPEQYANWKAQFGTTMDPRVFIADQIDPAKVGTMVKRMNPKEQKNFGQQYNWAVQNGYINGPQ